MEIIKEPEILAAIITAILGLIGYLLKPKAKVIWSVGHQFCYNVPQNNGSSLLIYSRSLYISNIGKNVADNIEIHFSYKPEHYQIWPFVNYSSLELPDNHFMIKIDHLGKNEYVNIELLQSSIAPPLVHRLSTLNGDCKFVHMVPQQTFSRIFHFTVWILLLAGVYKFFEIVILIVNKFVV
jgi:hypothetical protein